MLEENSKDVARNERLLVTKSNPFNILQIWIWDNLSLDDTARAPGREARTMLTTPNAPVDHSWSSSTRFHTFVPTNTGARNAAPCTRLFLGTSFGHLGQSRPMRLDGECLQLLRPQQHMGHELQFSSMLAAASWCQPPAKILKGLLECSDWSAEWGVFAEISEMIWNSECVRCMTLSFYPRRPWLIPVQTSLLNAVPPIHLWNFRNPQWNLLSAWRSARHGGPLMQIHWNLAYFEQFKWG